MPKATHATPAEPTMTPPNHGASASSSGTAVPVEMPPNGGKIGSSASATRPHDLTTDELSGAVALTPPATAAVSAGVSAWLSDNRVNALWTMNENRNAWVSIAGIGWKKLSTATDSSIVAMMLMASSARHTQSRFDYREEADGMVHEIYLW